MAVIIDPTLTSARRLIEARYAVAAPGTIEADLRVGLLNLMPTVSETEYDFLQLLAPAPCNVEITLIRAASHRPRHAAPPHMATHYTTWEQLPDNPCLDGLIVTGAPLDFVDFEDVDYWHEMQQILDDNMAASLPVMYVCWGAFAALYHRYGIPMHRADVKLHGIYPTVSVDDPEGLFRGLPAEFAVPYSRYARWPDGAIEQCKHLAVTALSQTAGVYIAKDIHAPHYYVSGHVEYDSSTLHNEYLRDKAKGINPRLPEHYYPDDDPTLPPPNRWHDNGVTIFANWLKLLKSKLL